MAYGVEAVSPVEISLMTAKVEHFNPEGLIQWIHFYNDLLEEERDDAAAKILFQQSKIALTSTRKSKSDNS